jgi:hypothetical protein
MAWRPIGQPGPAVAVAHNARAWVRRGVATAAEADAVARAATASRRLVRCKVMMAVGGARQARREMVRLTEEVGRKWGGGERLTNV